MFKIFSALKDPEASRIFEELPEGCELAASPSDADVLFLEEPMETQKPEAYKIGCLSREKITGMSQEEISYYYDVWVLPPVPGLWRARFHNLIINIRELQTAYLEKSWLETLIDSMPDMVWFKSLDGLHMKVNQAFCKACGKTKRMIEGRDHYFIWNVDQNDADHDDTCVESEKEVVKANRTCSFNEVLKIGDRKRHLLTHKTPIHDRHGGIIGTVGVAHDITNILNLNMEIEIFLEAMPFPLIMFDDKHIITHINKIFSAFFHEKKSDIIGTNYYDWKKWFFKEGKTSYSFDNGKKFVSILETDLKDVFGNVFGGVSAFRDITAEKSLEIQILKNATEDSLTGLANRHALSEFFDNMGDDPFHLLYIDLDNFKHVNDMYGHETGDMALRKIAKVMREVCPQDFLARLGGDEFLICLKRDISSEELISLANIIQATLNDWFSSLEKFSGISLSIGIRPDCDLETPVEQLIHEADQAMYSAKRSGKAQARLWQTPAGQ